MHAAAATKNDFFTLIGKPSPRLIETYQVTQPLMQHALGEDQHLSNPLTIPRSWPCLNKAVLLDKNCTTVLYSSHKGTYQCEDYWKWSNRAWYNNIRVQSSWIHKGLSNSDSTSSATQYEARKILTYETSLGCERARGSFQVQRCAGRSTTHTNEQSR